MANQDLNPQLNLQGSSYIYSLGMSPNTRAAMSQKVRILSPSAGSGELAQIGVLGNFGPSFSRSTEEVRGIGFGDRIAELVPGVQSAVTISLERTMLYLSNLWQALGYNAGVSGPVRSLKDQRWPFDLQQQLVFSEIADTDLGDTVPNSGYTGGVQDISFPSSATGTGGGVIGGRHKAVITMYEGCWLQDTSFSFSKDAQVVSESGSAMVTDVHDFSSIYGEFMPTGNSPYEAGQRGSILYTDGTQDRSNLSVGG